MPDETPLEDKRRRWQTRRGLAERAFMVLVVEMLVVLAVFAYCGITGKSFEITGWAGILGTLGGAFAGIVVAYTTNATWDDVKGQN